MTDASGRVMTRIIVHGRVQGVGYRYWAQSEARRLGLDGWVRNRRDGTVEAVLTGPADALTAMIRSCRSGPPLAQVTSIDETNATPDDLNLRPAGGGFASLPTV